jgi:hypothetical protein
MKINEFVVDEEIVQDAIVRIPQSEIFSQGKEYLDQLKSANPKTIPSMLNKLKPVPDDEDLRYGIIPRDEVGQYHVIIVNNSDQIIGDLALAPVKDFPMQPAYTVEFITVTEDYRGMGIGNLLYKIALRDQGIQLIAGESQTVGGRRNWISLSKTPGVTISGWGWVNVSEQANSNPELVKIQKKFEKSMTKAGATSLGVNKGPSNTLSRAINKHWYLFPVHAGEKEFKAINNAIKIYYNDVYNLPFLYKVGLLANWGN